MGWLSEQQEKARERADAAKAKLRDVDTPIRQRVGHVRAVLATSISPDSTDVLLAGILMELQENNAEARETNRLLRRLAGEPEPGTYQAAPQGHHQQQPGW